jgi:hypothetical protein
VRWYSRRPVWNKGAVAVLASGDVREHVERFPRASDGGLIANIPELGGADAQRLFCRGSSPVETGSCLAHVCGSSGSAGRLKPAPVGARAAPRRGSRARNANGADRLYAQHLRSPVGARRAPAYPQYFRPAPSTAFSPLRGGFRTRPSLRPRPRGNPLRPRFCCTTAVTPASHSFPAWPGSV